MIYHIHHMMKSFRIWCILSCLNQVSTLIDIANALDTTLDALICDNLVKGKAVFDEEISQELEECSEEDIRIVYDMVKALVKSLAKRQH